MRCFQRALKLAEVRGGKDDIQVAISCKNIGKVHRVKGEYDQALEYVQKALAIELKLHGPNHPDVAVSYGSIGMVYNAKGKYDQALEYFPLGCGCRGGKEG